MATRPLPESRWRREARAIIEQTLADLPTNATRQQKQQALREAYPWGLREHWPYKQWCIEQRLALGPGKVTPPIDRVEFLIDRGKLIVACTWCQEGLPDVRVVACVSLPQPGCLVCDAARRELDEHGPGWEKDFAPWLAVSCRPDGSLMRIDNEDLGLQLIFADYIEERGFGVMANHYRKYCEVAGKRNTNGEGGESAGRPATGKGALNGVAVAAGRAGATTGTAGP